MIRLKSASEVQHAYAHRRLGFTTTQWVAMGLVMGSVHPGNLGPLPPSPRALILKAETIGLISMAEVVAYN